MALSSAHNRMNLNGLLSDISSYATKIKNGRGEKTASPAEEKYSGQSPRYEPEGKAARLDGNLAFSAQQLASSAEYYKFTRPERSYALNSYNTVFNADKPAKIRLDFMHEYNRNFDFKI